MSFSKYIKEVRAKNNITQKQLSQILDVSLVNVKKIESGHIKMPSPKVLDSLVAYLKDKPENIIKDIIFFDETEYPINTPEYLRIYLAKQYLKGWNVEIGVEYKSDLVGKRIYPAMITKKREPGNKILIDTLATYADIENICKDPIKAKQFILNLLLTQSESNNFPNIKEYKLVLDSHSSKEMKIFENNSNFKIGFIKVKVNIEKI